MGVNEAGIEQDVYHMNVDLPTTTERMKVKTPENGDGCMAGYDDYIEWASALYYGDIKLSIPPTRARTGSLSLITQQTTADTIGTYRKPPHPAAGLRSQIRLTVFPLT